MTSSAALCPLTIFMAGVCRFHNNPGGGAYSEHSGYIWQWPMKMLIPGFSPGTTWICMRVLCRLPKMESDVGPALALQCHFSLLNFNEIISDLNVLLGVAFWPYMVEGSLAWDNLWSHVEHDTRVVFHCSLLSGVCTTFGDFRWRNLSTDLM